MAIESTAPLAGPAPVVAPPGEPRGRGSLWADIRRHRTDYLWVAPALLVLVLVIGYPFVYTIDLSFYDTPPSSPNWYFNGVDNYVQILRDRGFWAITLNTVYWAVGSTVLAFGIGLGAALVVQREFIGRGLLRALLLIPYVISYVAAAYVWRWLYHSDYGLISGTLYDYYLIDQNINFLDVTTSMLPYGIPFPVIPESTEIMNNIVPTMVQNALTGKMSVKEAADDAANAIKTLIAQRKS